ncbi:hypothetical protein [Peloplasma aerotolerans]|uniref:Uncharacterized protein n=1 Tax=Peloplasma aerotolerans TaxID=3044389 RepID=A0AAW6UAJ5_9MOLU|nr:hypothetical protein [Mariniplasma sp. M4Ah]MDI6451963.1 hypothetical protein [Mariniplasma sp. M4Ah]
MKSFETDLKEQLSVDKKYLPISKKLVAVLRDVNPFLAQTIEKHNQVKEKFFQTMVEINKDYAENMENYKRSLDLIIEKNHDEIEKSQKEKVHKTHELNGNLKSELEVIEQKINQINLDAEASLDKADQVLKRDLSQIRKVMIEAKKVYQETTLEIEKEKTETTKVIAKSYDLKVKAVEKKLKKFETDFEKKLMVIKENSQKASSDHDDSYLTIKNTYTELSISLNKKINDIKKKYQQSLVSLDKSYQTKIKPIQKSIEDLKKEYQETQKKALITYSEKLNSLNVVFDVQKQGYETKRERIIHEGNDSITLFNSKLSAYRESTQKEKLLKSREMRDEMKSLESEYEKDKKNHQLTRELNSFDQELNKQIIRTNKDILVKKRETQKKLFELDQKHLREINEWRLKKSLYEYEKKQEFAKIDLNYNHNISASESLLKLQEIYQQSQKEVLLLNHNKDLLPLEYQLAIAASIQERELNLLANDAHLTIASFKHEEQTLEFEHKKNLALIEMEREKIKALFNADTQVLNTTTQLELEKEKAKRDYSLKEQDLRSELSQAIFNKSKQQIQNKLNEATFSIESDREIIYIDNKYTLELIKEKAKAEEDKRTFFVNEAKYKHQQRVNNEKANRLLKTYQCELELQQEQTEMYLNIMRLLYQNHQTIEKAVSELYHVPSHPEVFKATLKILIDLNQELLNSTIQVTEYYQKIDQDFYLKKIDDLTGYKYMLKHEDMMNYYEQEIEKINEQKKLIQKEISLLEEQFFANQTELERNHAFINQLGKINQDIKSNESKSEHRHHDLKENQKLLSNHEHEVKRIKQNLTRIEKSIDEKHAQITPLDEEIIKLETKQKDSEKDLEKTKHDEASFFYRYLNRNQKVYLSFIHQLKQHFDGINQFYQSLYSEVYVSDAFLTLELKKLKKNFLIFDKNLTIHHQRFLDVMLKFYQTNQKEQEAMIRGFKKTTYQLIHSLNANYENNMKYHESERKKKLRDKERQITAQNDKIKKKLELESISHKKKLVLDQSVIRSLEQKISENKDKQEQELKLLNENQLSIATQYAFEHQQKTRQLEDLFNKTKAQIDSSIMNADKNHTGLEASIGNKNQVILTRYQASHDKNLLALKQKTKHYEDLIAKQDQSNIERNNQYDQNLKRMNQRREAELNNIKAHLEKFSQQTKNSQNRVLHRDYRILKKAHRSKLRLLHLN